MATINIKSGDTLSKIAQTADITLNQLLNANPQFKDNPDKIFPGQNVTIPGTDNQSSETPTPRTPADLAKAGIEFVPGFSEKTSAINTRAVVEEKTAPSLGTFNLPSIPDITAPTAEEVLRIARSRPDVQLAKEGVDIAKERVREALPLEKINIAKQFESRGLFFSGERTVEQKRAEAASLAKELDIDMRFSEIILNAIEKTRSELGKEIEDVIKEAENKRKDAISFLKDIGLAVDPNTGELYPTLEAIKEQRIAEQEQVQNSLTEARLSMQQAQAELSAAKSEIQIGQAYQRLAISEANLTLQQAKYYKTLAEVVNSSFGFANITIESDARQTALDFESSGKTAAETRSYMRAAFSQQEVSDYAIETLVNQIYGIEPSGTPQAEEIADSWLGTLFSGNVSADTKGNAGVSTPFGFFSTVAQEEEPKEVAVVSPTEGAKKFGLNIFPK